MSNSVGLVIFLVIYILAVLGIAYGFRYFVGKLKEKIPQKSVPRTAMVFIFFVLTVYLGLRALDSLKAMLLRPGVLYNPGDLTECFVSERTESMRMGCIKRHAREVDEISVCNAVEGIQLKNGVQKDDEYFVSRDHCILTLVGFFYHDTSQLKHKEWCYELSDSKVAGGGSLEDACVSKFSIQ